MQTSSADDTFTLAEIAQGFGTIESALPLPIQGAYEIIFYMRESASAFILWAHAMGYTLRKLDLWSVRITASPTVTV